MKSRRLSSVHSQGRLNRALSRMEPLESRCLLSASIMTPALQVSPDRWGGGGWGGWGGGGGNGYGNNGNNGGTTTQGYIPPNGYSPSQISTAYGFGSVTINGTVANGAGETIAIVDAYNDPNISSDLKTFDSEFNLAAPPSFTQVSQTGGSVSSIATNAGWALEISLDVEWAHAVAPGANIMLVEATNDNTNNLLAAVNYARSAPGVAVVSMSWGGGEFSNESKYDSDFTTPSGHTGVTFVSAAGDSPGAEWPASSPNVISVGGTTLETTNSTGTYGTETAWSDSGGGLSQFEKEPSYQDTALTGGSRGTPDVAYDADPNTGFQVYDSLNYEGVKGWQEIGGTSAGTPQWSALIAISDQVRAADGETALNGATQTLPLLYGAYAAPSSSGYATYASVFHDITSGGGGFFSSSATTGYDLVSGLGSPDAPNIVATLSSKPVTPNVVRATKTETAAAPKPPHTPIGMFSNPPPAVAQAVNTNPQYIAPAIIPARVATNDAQLAALDQSDAIASTSNATSGNGTSLVSAALVAQPAVLTYDRSETASPASPFSQFASVAVNDVTMAEESLSAVAMEAAISIKAAAATSPVVLKLAQLDADIFADSLRSFVHESAHLQAGVKDGGWTSPLAMGAAAILADAVLIGFWYMNRSRGKSKSPVLAAPGQDD